LDRKARTTKSNKKPERMLKIYHNPRCSKSRKGLEYLQTKNSEFEIVEYMKDGLSSEQIKEILLKSNLKPTDIIRTHEELYIKELKDKKFTDEEWIEIIVENPKLLQRPIIIGKHKAVFAQPAEKLDELLK
jgi:arsenate reductase (glutaredoxin)